MADDIPDLALQEGIRSFFREGLHATVPAADTDLIATGVLDSLALVELLLQIETQYGVRVSLDKLDFDDFRSVARIARFVARERNSGDGAGAG
jgi:acyl carrier protein